MSRQTENRQLRIQCQHFFRADGVGTGRADQRNVVDLRELRPIGGVGLRVKFTEIALPADDSVKRFLALKQRKREEQAAFSEYHTLNIIRHGNRASRNVCDGDRLCRYTEQAEREACESGKYLLTRKHFY